jgi:hypothetical protein
MSGTACRLEWGMMSDSVAVTSAETRILLSFALADHGGQFAHWLRNRLMKRFNYYSVNNVYMDCVAVRGLPSVHTTAPVPDADRLAGVTYVTPDNRPHFQQQGYKPIGAGNSDWNGMYLKAMSEAHTIIMVVTPSYLASQWCTKESLQFHEERKRRPKGIKDIVIRFTDSIGSALQEPDGLPLQMTGMTPLLFPKVMGLGGMLWHPADYGFSETHLQTVFDTIGQG